MTRWGSFVLVLLTALSVQAGCQTQQPAKIGNALRKATLSDLAGRTHTIPNDFQGQVVLIQFWTISCPLCVGEMTGLESVYQTHKHQGFVILAVNVAQTKENVETFLKPLNISYPVLLDPDATTANRYGVLAFPATILLDRQGIVRGKLFGPSGQDTLDKLVTEALNQ